MWFCAIFGTPIFGFQTPSHPPHPPFLLILPRGSMCSRTGWGILAWGNSGGIFVFQIGAEMSPRFFFGAIRAISCSLGRLPTFVFCGEALVPVYCTSGLHVKISLYASAYPKSLFLCNWGSQRMLLCMQCATQQFFLCSRYVSQGLWFPRLYYTRHQNLGVPRFSLPKPPPPPLYVAAR